jgi:hypothetical protein
VHILFFWVLKWNLKIALKTPPLCTGFLKDTFGCYALRFIDRVMRLELTRRGGEANTFPDVRSGEKMGVGDKRM